MHKRKENRQRVYLASAKPRKYAETAKQRMKNRRAWQIVSTKKKL